MSPNETITEHRQEFVSPEYSVPFEIYLNLYHGIDIDPSRIEHYSVMEDDQKATFEAFSKRVRSIDWDKEEGLTSCQNQPLVLPDDMTCLRFLQADKYDEEMALKRIIATLKWQQEWNLAHVMSIKPEKLDLYRRVRVRANMGRTKDGMPIFVERLGGFLNGIPSKEGQQIEGDEYVKCFLYDLGLMLRRIRESYEESKGSVTWQATWIMDVKGVRTMRAMKATSTIKLLDSMTEPNFPEFAGPIYLINVPSIVAGVWKIVKAFLDPSVVAKIQVSSGVPKKALLERMDESVLFEEYGGTNKAEFPKSEFV